MGMNINIEGYKLIRNDRSSRRGVGMAIYVRENPDVEEITEIHQHMPSKDIWIEIIGEEDEGFNIWVCYRPPASDSSVKTVLFKNIKQEVMEPLGTSDRSTIGFDVFWQNKRDSSKSRIFFKLFF